MSEIKGLSTEIPEGMEPTAQTIAVLLAVEQKGAAGYEGDDSPVSVETIGQLEEIAGNVGYRCWRAHRHLCFILDDSVHIVSA